MDEFDKKETHWLPDGFHFIGPTETQKRKLLIHKLTQYLEDQGYSEVMLPSMDYYRSFLKNVMPEEEDSILRLRDLSGRELSPGFDLTVQVVKGMAGLSHHTENQNVFYLARRIRDHKKRNASRREILQLGAERLGSSHPQDIIKILIEVDTLLQISGLKKRPSLVIGNSIILKEILCKLSNQFSLNPDELRAMIHSKNLPKLKELFIKAKLSKEWLDLLVKIILSVEWKETFELFKSSPLFKELPSYKDILNSLEFILSEIQNKDWFSTILLDLSMVRDLNYYTGYMFVGYLPGEPEPVITGGEYDHLWEIYSEKPREACGYAFHIDVLMNFI